MRLVCMRCAGCWAGKSCGRTYKDIIIHIYLLLTAVWISMDQRFSAVSAQIKGVRLSHDAGRLLCYATRTQSVLVLY